MSESMAALLTGVTLISTGVALIATCIAIAAANSARANARKLRAARPLRKKQRTTTVATPIATQKVIVPPQRVAS